MVEETKTTISLPEFADFSHIWNYVYENTNGDYPNLFNSKVENFTTK